MIRIKRGDLAHQRDPVHIDEAVEEPGEDKDDAGYDAHAVFDMRQAIKGLADFLGRERDEESKYDNRERGSHAVNDRDHVSGFMAGSAVTYPPEPKPGLTSD